MAIDIGTVKGEEITTNKDGDDNVRLLQVELSNPDDLQTIEHLRQPGDDSSPQPGSRVIVLDVGKSYRVAVAVDDGIEPTADPGEKILYSFDDTPDKLAWIHLASNGSITIRTASGAGAIVIASNGDIDMNGGYLTIEHQVMLGP